MGGFHVFTNVFLQTKMVCVFGVFLFVFQQMEIRMIQMYNAKIQTQFLI